jgi:2-polyprenyl-6-methoxyphenol hydroxylase-like FAD-dependent oxidoreductase
VAGPALAYWLREYGYEPVLFERAPQLRTGGYVIDFWGVGYELAERMGIVADLEARGYRMRCLRAVDAAGKERVGLDFAALTSQVGRFVSIPRGDIAALLFEACRGVSSHFGVSIETLQQSADGVTVALSDGTRQRFDLVIGADGLHSQVRELAFGPEQQFLRPLGCHVAAFRLRGYRPREELTYVAHTVVGKQAARVSLRDDQTLVLLVCRSELLDLELAERDPAGALTRAFGDMGWEVPELLRQMRQTDELYFDGVSQVHMPRWSQGRVALVGDAAACVSLLAGEGTGLAILEAYVLAGELARARGDHARAFAAYEARLSAFLRDKQRGALRMRSFFAPQNKLALWLRDLGIWAASRPLLVRAVAGSALRDDIELPRYEAELSSAARAEPAAKSEASVTHDAP